jgi:MFS transporter, ACS family, solute carrier family 17 (sodium-dependent inorganic phosphate cotransporter), member 5
MAEKLGGKLVYGVGVFLTSIFTLLTPIAARISLPALVTVRILEGLGEGVTFPSMHAMLAKWVPKTERSRFAAVVYNGANFGTIVSIPMTGFLCSLDFMGGWPLSFYIFGCLGIIWCFFWWWLVFNTPETHPRISTEERIFIQKSLRNKDDDFDHDNNDPVPWLSIASSVPLWALLITTW